MCFRERGLADGFDNKSEGKELGIILPDLQPEKWGAGTERGKKLMMLFAGRGNGVLRISTGCLRFEIWVAKSRRPCKNLELMRDGTGSTESGIVSTESWVTRRDDVHHQSRLVERGGEGKRGEGRRERSWRNKISDKPLPVRHSEVSRGSQARVCTGEAYGT